MKIRAIVEGMAAVLEERMGDPCTHSVQDIDGCTLCRGRKLLSAFVEWKKLRESQIARKVSASAGKPRR